MKRLVLLLLLLASPLHAQTTPTSVTLEWTAPSDNVGVTTYDMRRSAAPITSANFGSATQVTGEPAPLTPGTLQSMTVSGLTASTLYYFAVKAGDAAGNWSGISNVVSATTSPTPETIAPGAPTGLRVRP